MQRCSQSIGAIAGALAKAQIELANPNLQMKSRLPRSPCHGDRLRLDNGLTGDTVTADDAEGAANEPFAGIVAGDQKCPRLPDKTRVFAKGQSLIQG
jgi:hypothetical protein